MDAGTPHVARETGLRVRWAASRTLDYVLAGLVLAVVALALAVPVSGGTLVHPREFAVLEAWSVVAFVFAGRLWWHARPWNPIGPLLCALGLILGLEALQGSADGLIFSVAVLLYAIVLLAAWYLVVAFPTGYLDATGRVLMGIGGGVLLLGYVPRTLLSQHVMGVTPLANCGLRCPANQLLVATDPSLLSLLSTFERMGRIVFTLLLTGMLVARVLRAAPPRRRMVIPVYLTFVVWLVAYSIYNVAVHAGAAHGVVHAAGVSVTLAQAVVPLGFIAAIVLARAYAGVALESMVRELGRQVSAGSIETLVRRVLFDPSARLAFWLPRSKRYVDVSARRVEHRAGDRVSWRVFASSSGEPIVAIMHDPVLDEDPELVDAAGFGTALALENRRLDETLRRSIQDLDASRVRLVTAVAEERRRIERDIHDGSQQRLLAIRIQLELARSRAIADPGTLERLAELGEELDEALDELRAIAHGIYPALLGEEGLRPALTEAATRCGALVDLDLASIGRYEGEIEAAVYFSCVEALQNVAKHAGSGAQVHLRLWEDAGSLNFSVSDDGVGFESAPGTGSGGSGLSNMSDRLRAFGGSLSVEAEPRHGTTVAGSLPVARTLSTRR